MRGFALRRGFATLALAALVSVQPFVAAAQSGLPRTVLWVTYTVAPENREAFKTWIADFRTAVEKLIADGKLSAIDLCAYKSWRVLGPDAAGLNENFVFVFEPVIPIANYSLKYYLGQALGDAEMEKRMQAFAALATNPQMLYASPLTKADAVDLGQACQF